MWLIATGDVLGQDSVKAAAAAANRPGPDGGSLNHGGFDTLLAGAAPFFAVEGSVGFANLETPIAPHASSGTRPFVFDAPPDLLAALKAIGFTVLSCANNHAYDQGRAGLVETVENVKQAGLLPLGAGPDHDTARAPVVLERNGMRLGFLGYTARLNENLNTSNEHEPETNWAEPARMVREVAALVPKVDVVIVSLHWGTEYALAPDGEQVALAHRLVDAGALIVLGTHPHVLQRIERYDSAGAASRRSLIVYSLGNFISNQSRHYVPGVDPVAEGDTRDGIALAMLLVRTPKGVEVRNTSYRPIWTINNANVYEKDPQILPIIRLIPTEADAPLWTLRAPRYELRLGDEIKLNPTP